MCINNLTLCGSKYFIMMSCGLFENIARLRQTSRFPVTNYSHSMVEGGFDEIS